MSQRPGYKNMSEDNSMLLAQMHRCYDALQVGICAVSSDGSETVIFANQAVLDMYACSSFEDFLTLVHGTFGGMFSHGAQPLATVANLRVPVRLSFETSTKQSQSAYGIVRRIDDEQDAFYLLQLWHPQVPAARQKQDELTFLAGPGLFERQAEAFFGKDGAGTHGQWYLVFFDIANFRGFNQYNGTDGGNRCLAYVAALLKKVWPDSLMCRINADHFQAILPEENIFEKIEEVCARVNLYMGTQNSSLKAGLVSFAAPFSLQELQEGFAQAMQACGTVKNDGLHCWALYDEQMQQTFAYRSYILDHLDQALEAGYIRVLYQPVVHTYFNTVSSFEALARWQDPEKGMIPPGIFVPILEQAGRIDHLDRYIMKQVVIALHENLVHDRMLVPVSLNLSLQDFDLMSPLDELNALTLRYGVPRKYIHVEITERVVASSRERMEELINCFHESGYDVWLDDFGSAYSSLNALHSFSFDLIKLDMEFFRNFNYRSRDIVTSIVMMAKRLGMHTLAEGVETDEQIAFLRHIGCELIQGYFFSKPIPPQLIDQTLDEKHLRLEQELEAAVYGAVGLMDLISENPLCQFLMDHGRLRIFAENDACRKEINSIGLASPEDINQVFSSNPSFRRKLYRYLDKVMKGYTKAITIVNQDQYVRLQAFMTSGVEQFWAGAISIMNISDDPNEAISRKLDETFRNLVLLYDGIYCMDLANDEVDVVECGHPQVMPGTTVKGIRQAFAEYAQELVHYDDQQRFRSFLDAEKLQKRLQASAHGYAQDLFRIKGKDGNYKWKVFKATQIGRGGRMDILICEAMDLWESKADRRQLLPVFAASMEPDLFDQDSHNELADQQELAIFHAFMQNAKIPLFWKDRQLRYAGMNGSALARFGGLAREQVIGRNMKELDLLVDPDIGEAMEKEILKDGKGRNGGCLLHLPGHLRRRAVTEFPWYRGNQIAGVAGVIHSCVEDNSEFFLRDEGTSLFNTYGILLAGADFARAYQSSRQNYCCILIALHQEDHLRRTYGDAFIQRIVQTAAGSLLAFGKEPGILAAHLYGCRFLLMGKEAYTKTMVKAADAALESVRSMHEIDGVPCQLEMMCAMGEGNEADSFLALLQLLNKRIEHDHKRHQDVDSMLSLFNRIGVTTSVLDEIPERVILLDPLTHEVLYINRAMKQDLNLPQDFILHGQKCHELLYDRDDICPWCFNSMLSSDILLSRQQDFSSSGTSYTTRNILIPWHGRMVRLCIAIPNQKNDSSSDGSLLQDESWANDVIHAGLGEQDPSVGILRTLQEIARHLQAERFLIFEEKENDTLCCSYEWCSPESLPVKQELQCVPKKDLAALYEMFVHKKVVMIDDYCVWKQEHPLMHLPIAPVTNIISGHLMISDSSKGFTLVVNSSRESLHPAGYMLSTLTDFIAVMLRNRDSLMEAQWKSMHDALTGVLNRSGIECWLKELENASRFALIACDINGLKDVNDQDGHLAGDALIQRAASVLTSFVDNEHVVRMGGDEFLVLVKEQQESGIIRMVEQIRRECVKRHCEMAAGYTMHTGRIRDLDDLICKADAAMYADKGGSHRKKS